MNIATAKRVTRNGKGKRSPGPARKKRPKKKVRDKGESSTGDASTRVSQETDVVDRIGPVQKGDVSKFVRHPVNRIPTDDAVVKIADSYRKVGQLEPILVRAYQGDFQILGGETRWRAKKENGESEIEFRVMSNVSDAEALIIVAEANAAREDLNPIERAKLAQHLCKPIHEGGSGLNHDQVGDVLKLSRSSVSNCIRLLKLPAKIQRLLVENKLPESYARDVIPLFESYAGAIAEKILLKWVGQCDKGKRTIHDEYSREDFADSLLSDIGDKSRTLKPADRYSKSSQWTLETAVKRPGQYTSCYFKPTDDQLAELKAFEFKGAKRALNVKLWDKLNKAAAAELLKNLKAGKSKKSDAGSGKSKKKLTPAQLKAKQKKDDELLQKKIDRWRHEWLKDILQTKFNSILEPDISQEVLVVVARVHGYLAANDLSDCFDFYEIDHPRNPNLGGAEDWGFWNEITVDQINRAKVDMVWRIMVTEDPKTHTLFPTRILEDLASMLDVDLRRQWQDLDTDEDSRFHQFVLLHNSDQVNRLARQLKVKLPKLDATRKVRIGNLLEGVKLVVMPKEIAPLPGLKTCQAEKETKVGRRQTANGSFLSSVEMMQIEL